MADSYLNKSGLSYFWTKIKNALSLKTDKVDFDLVDRYYRALVPVGIEITSNKNLDTVEFLSVGKYYCHNNATAATLTNCPTGGRAFMMEVFSPLSTTIDNETTGTRVYRTRIITTYEGKTWYQSCYSNETAGNWIYGSWKYMPNSGDVDNQIYANTNSKYGRVQCNTYTADSGKWVKIASMSHHTRSNDNVNYTFRLDFTGSGNAQYRQSYTFGVGARMSNTSLGSVRFDYLDSEKFNFNGAPEFEDLVKVTRKWVAGSSSADHYIYFEIWVHLLSGWKTYWLHPTNMNYKGDYSINQAFFRNSDEWTYSYTTGTSAQIGQETYLTDGYEEVPMVDARKGVSYLDPFYTTRQTTADVPEIIGRGGIRTFVATASMSDRPADGNILHLDWDNTGGWDSQLMVSHADSIGPNIYARGMSNGTWGDWVRFVRNGDSATFNNIKLDRVNTYPHIGGDGTYLAFSVDGLWGQGHGSIALKSDSLYPSTTESGLINLGESGRLWKNLYLSDNIHKGDYVFTLPNKTGTVALTSDIPTKVSDIENDLNFIEDDTTQVCDEDSDIELEGTTKAPLEIKQFEGKTFQQNYEGKNLLQITRIAAQTKNGITITFDGSSFVLDGTATASTDLYIHGASWGDTTEFVALLAGTYTLSVRKADMSLGANFGAKMYNNSGSGQRIFDFNANTSGVATTTLDADSGFTNFYITINSGVTFNNERFYAQLEKSSSVSDWEPFVGGKASPSPEYPQSISTVTGRNVVEVQSKNRFNNSPRPYSGSNLNVTTDSQVTRVVGDITSWWNLEWTGDKLNLVPGETYTARCFILDNPKNYTGTTNLWFDIQGQQVAQAVSLTAASGYQNTFTYAVEQPLRALRIAFAGNNAGVDITFCIQIEKGSIATDFAPFSKQTYEINLGKNLFNKTDVVNGALLADGTIDSTNYPNCRTTGYIAVKPNTAYCISGRTTWSVQGEYTKDRTFISRSTGDSLITGPNTYYVRIVCVNSELENMQFEAGSVATSYSDYFDPIEFCRIATAYDYIHRDGEDFYIHREIGKYVFDGSETYVRNGTYNFQTNTPFADYLKSSIEDNMAISDKFIYFANSGGSISTLLPDLNFAFSQDKTRAQFRYDAIASPTDFKAWMEDNQLTVYYVLLNPTEEKITNEELISQLRDLWNATGYDDRTTITVLSYGNNSRAILSVCQYPNHIPVASQYKVGSVTVGDGVLVDDGGRISLDMSYIGTSIMKLSNSEIDTIMGVQ